ncbi:short-chain fatty acid transporter [Heyndrickxia oleronia]|uniref:Short-chain fatty acid transporter n=1 Tax=Heyndrickxia oleronia TaxID=38875 RepID=A0A8E2I7Z4_9BACI|nr:short-chain fatty acid transporter [Heyndrickxia oleronia]OJH16450.1 short-chain fatty acid transporter [Bacillus obstructivus]MBU5211279.1 short-chain fatty acid transporter [Heyndrickxia oleronia]MCM3456436.1 short-chain fatty acid transporter [Heyndrickxia oleronia]MEC1373218.1 short-chain fatty acid transporter [Heyndrickxia oleronia]OOP67992.1 short-chain fatty acid transporter [Heyndrickxia oleronia]
MKGIINFSNHIMQRYLPDPYLFVVLLTFVVFILGLIFTGSSPIEMVQFWGEGFWELLDFSMQMVLVLVTGHVLASSPLFKKILGGLATTAKSPGSAIIIVTVVSIIASWINWGFGLVIGALFAKELAKRVKDVDYRLLIASAYSGFLVWHGGISGSIPLSIATDKHPFESQMGIISTSETIFSTYNIAIVLALFIILPLLNRFMMPSKDKTITVDPAILDDATSMHAASIEKDSITPATRLENSFIVSLIIGILGLIFISYYIITHGFQLNLNIVNFTFLFLGILCHWTPKRFLDAVANAVKGAAGIIIQFPFYAGIMGMMTASGLAAVMSEAFVSISNDFTFYCFAFLSGGLVNFFVPSGGGQWAVQAPIMLDAAQSMGASLSKTAMAIAWGDAWTNMIQPFWALPALAIAGLKAKDIMGFCVIILIVSGVIISLGMLFL